MSDIPDDVMKAARECFSGERWDAWNGEDDEREGWAHERIIANVARAVMAAEERGAAKERERCAAIALNEPEFVSHIDNHWPWDKHHIAAAIRKYP